MQHFGDIMFTDTVKSEQEKQGSREAYADMTSRPAPKRISEREIDFIQSRDSFYLSTVTETGWPYIQHRGGPRGFLKVLGPQTLGFADYSGNRQYVSSGNLKTDDRVALFLMDYPHRRRLKLIGHGSWVTAAEQPDLAERLDTPDSGRVERLFTIDIVAFDWNCPQFITPRFTEADIQAILGPKLEDLESENVRLKARLMELENR